MVGALLCAPDMARASSLALPPISPTFYENICKDQWTKRGILDKHMYDYCVERQQEGYDKFVDLATKYATKPWIQQLVDFSVNQWTKHGNRNDQMVGFQLSKELDAYEDLIYEKHQPGFDPVLLKNCFTKWGIQFSMVNHCIKQAKENQDTLSPNPQIDLNIFEEFFTKDDS
jgi:hypothetical protein